MKLSISILAVASASSVSRVRKARQAGIDQGPRRYSQLMEQMNYYNSDFDEREYWSYGCHCFFLGDRPMSDMGKGSPVDALDATCKQYKECLKCARDEFGDMCIGEFVRYGLNSRNGPPTCNDNAGTCGRALCECDKMFAQNHVNSVDVFTTDFHDFWSTTGWMDNKENVCVPRGGGSADPQCCGKSDSFSVIYNAERAQCCDGEVKGLGEC